MTTTLGPAASPVLEGSVRPHVLLWGPFPHEKGVFGGGIGGYARCNSEMLESLLAKHARLEPLPMSVPRFAHRTLAAVDLGPRMLDDMTRLSRALARRRPDVLHVTALYWRSIFREAFAVRQARRHGIPVIYDIRAGTFEHFVRGANPGARRALHYVMRRAAHVTVEGERYGPLVKREFGREATWVPNFVRDAVLDAHAPASLTPPGPGEPFRLAFVGYLIPEKGVDVLLEAAQRLSRRTPVEVTLIGAVSDRIKPLVDRHRALAGDRYRVLATGRLELDEVLGTLRQQHLFVFLSRFFGEGHSNAVTEAMAMGLPVMTSRHGFLAEVVTDEAGVIVDDPTDVDEVVRRLTCLRDDWGGLARRGGSARRRIRERFSEGAVLTATADLYRALAAKD